MVGIVAAAAQKQSGGGRKAPPPREVKTQLAECMKTKSQAECAEALTQYLPEDAGAKAGALQEMLRDGAKGIVGDDMEKCKSSGKSKAECEEQVREAMRNMMGGDVSREDLKEALEDAGRQKASDAVKACVAAASTRELKQACQFGAAAKDEFAKASGKNPADITDDDLKKAAKQGAIKELTDRMKGCMANGTPAEDCRKPEDMDALMKEFGFEDMSPQRMREFLDRGAQDEALNAVKGCKGMTGADKASCLESAKESFAQAAGKRPEDVKKFDMTKGAREALEREMSERMEFCVEDAGANDTAVQDCHKKMRDHLKDSRPGGKAPTDADVAKALRDGAERAARETRENCASGEDCEDKMKEAMAKALGKGKDQIKKMEMKKLAGEGAKKAAGEQAMACVEAKKDDPTATCEDLLASYMAAKGQSAPTDAKKRNVAANKVKKVVVGSMMKESASVCLEEASKADFVTCMQEASSSMDDTVKDLLGDAKATRADKKKKAAEAKGLKLAVGELFGLCMREAGGKSATNVEKQACKDELASNVELTGLGGADEAADNFMSSVFSDPLEACADADLKTCRAEAKEMAMEYGMPKRRFILVKRLGTIAATAETLAACLEVENTTSTDVDCEAEATEAFTKASGSEASAYADVKTQVERVAQLILDGETSELRKLKQLHLAFLSSRKTCADDKADSLVDKVNASKPEKCGSVTKESCQIVDDNSEYTFVVEALELSDDSFETASESMGEALANIEARRLRALQANTDLDVYVGQNTQECAVGDALCGVVANASSEEETTQAAVQTSGATSVSQMLSGAITIALSAAASLSA